MKRRMVHTKVKTKDPGYEAAKPRVKKADEPDVYPTNKVPQDKGKSARMRLRNKRI